MNTATHRGAAECGRRHDTGHLQVSSNLRFGWLSDANTGLFVVYNDTQGIGDFIPLGAGRSLTLKYSLLMDVLH